MTPEIEGLLRGLASDNGLAGVSRLAVKAGVDEIDKLREQVAVLSTATPITYVPQLVDNFVSREYHDGKVAELMEEIERLRKQVDREEARRRVAEHDLDNLKFLRWQRHQ